MTLKKQTANCITALRIVFTIVLFLTIESYFASGILKIHWIIISFLVCILSDFLDGKVARGLHIDSKLGANFDMLADCLYVFLLHTQLVFYGIMPLWFLILVIEKTVNYILTSHMIQQMKREEFSYIRDPIGRIVSAIYFFTPIIVLLNYHYYSQKMIVSDCILILISIAGLFSSLYRWKVIASMKNNG